MCGVRWSPPDSRNRRICFLWHSTSQEKVGAALDGTRPRLRATLQRPQRPGLDTEARNGVSKCLLTKAAAPARYSAEDRREQILQVATGLFAQQGFQGTTTRQIAQRARVNEAILFRHFPDKEAMYWAAIDDKCRRAGGRARLHESLRAHQPDRELFAAIGRDLLERNAKDVTLSRLLLFSALENHRLSHRFFRTYIAEYYEALAEHIRRRVGEGKFRRVDPLVAARGFLGMVIYHFLIQELFGGKRYQKFDSRKVCAILADIWLQGMLAHTSSSRPGKRSGGNTRPC